MVKIPSRLEELLPTAAMEKIMEVLHQPDITSTLRDALDKVGLKDANPLGQVQNAWRQARSWLETMADQIGGSLDNPSTINATGSLLSTDFSGVPMPPTVAFGYAHAAAAFQNSAALIDSTDHTARKHLGHPTAWLGSSFACLSLLQLPNIAAGGIVISRADTVRVPGFGDIRDMLTSLGGGLTEVGAANGAEPSDWTAALKSDDQLLVLVSPNSQSAPAAVQQREFAMAAAKQAGVPVAEILVDGVLSQELGEQYGFPLVAQRLSSGTDLVLLPTNFLLAAPTAMLAIGRESIVEALNSAAKARGIRCDGPQRAAIALAIQLANSVDEGQSGVINELLVNPENLKSRATRMAIQLNDSARVQSAVEVECRSSLGPGVWERYQLKNWAVRVKPRAETSQAASQLHKRLTQPAHGELNKPAIATRIDGHDILIDLRFVLPKDDYQIVDACLGE